MPEVITIGESMAILVPEQTGRLRYVRSFALRAAGAESNVAVGLCKLGHTAGWISRLGSGRAGLHGAQYYPVGRRGHQPGRVG